MYTLMGKDINFRDTSSMVAIIGSRKANADENDRAEILGYDLAKMGMTIVSGLAEGIDASAHKGALLAEGDHCRTLAIVSTAPQERIYPATNETMSEQIKQDGAILHVFDTIAPWTDERFGPKQKRLVERSVMQAVVSSSVYVVSDSDYIIGGTRWALNYAEHLGKNIFRYDSEGNVHANPDFKRETRLINWEMELDWSSCYRDLLDGNYKHIKPAVW